MSRVTKEEAAKAFEVLHQYIEDKNIGGGAYENMLLNWPKGVVFCEENQEELSSEIIELMALKSLARHFDQPYYVRVDDVIDRWKETILSYLIEH